MKRLAPVSLALLLAGCGTRGLGASHVPEHKAPTLTVTSPERATILGNVATVEVKGSASDEGSGLASVAINGLVVDVAGDGTFDAVVPVQAGITIVQTIATDRDGNTTTDSRSVMAGTLADPQATVGDGALIRVNSETLGALGDIGGEELTKFDFGAAAQAFNPIADAGITCLDVQVSVDSLDKSLVVLDLTPVDGGIAFDATIYDLDVEMTADFHAACIPGSAGLSLTADSYHLSGTFALGVDNGQLAANLVDAQGSFDNFALSVGFLPSSVVGLIPNLDQKIANMITDQLSAKVPALVSSYLGADGYTKQVSMFGSTLDVRVQPTAVDFTSSGGTIRMDTTFTVEGSNGGAGYPMVSAPVPAMPDQEAPGAGFRVAVNDNAVNQLLNAVWVTGVIDRTIDLSGDSGNSTGLAGLVDSVELYLAYPPMVTSDPASAAATVTVGDLMVTAYKDGQPVTKVAVSARLGLAPYVDATNQIRLMVDSPEAFIDVIDDGTVTGPNVLSDSSVEALGSYVVGHASTMLDSVVGAIPVPQFQSAAITNLAASAAPTGGYIELGGNVEPLN